MFFVEYHIKDQKAFWRAWEKAQSYIPKDCHFIQCFSSKDGELCISVWDCKSPKLLEGFMKEHFERYSKWKCHQIDAYHLEGEALKRLAS